MTHPAVEIMYKSATLASFILCVSTIFSGLCFIDVDKWWYKLRNGPPHWTHRIYEHLYQTNGPSFSSFSGEETMMGIVIRPIYCKRTNWLTGFKLSSSEESTVVESCSKGYYLVRTLNDNESRAQYIFSEEEVDEHIENHFFKNFATSTLLNKLD